MVTYRTDKVKILVIISIIFILTALISWLIFYKVKEHYLQSDIKLKEIKDKFKDFHPIMNDIKLLKSDKSYTLNKNKIHLCIKDENGEYYHDNMLAYVFLHELAHCINKKDVGHTEEFYRIFDELKDKASALGLWDPNIPPLTKYCGVNYDK